MSPGPREPEQPEYADADRYATLAGFGGDYRDLWWNPDFLELMARRWGLAERRTLLDVGCGAGHWGLTVLAHMPAEATMVGLDREPSFLALARDRAAARGLGSRVELVAGEVEALPFADASFDVVTCQTVLIHVAEPGRALAEMVRVLRPGGILIAVEPDNLAGAVALLGTSPTASDDDIAAIVAWLSACQRGKRALGEGDERVGHRLPALLAEAGLTELRCHTNDRCTSLVPPYADPAMRITLERELRWADEGVTILAGTRADMARLFAASGEPPEAFERGWAAVDRWREAFVAGVTSRSFAAARGFVMYLASGAKPGQGRADPL